MDLLDFVLETLRSLLTRSVGLPVLPTRQFGHSYVGYMSYSRVRKRAGVSEESYGLGIVRSPEDRLGA